VGSLALVLVQVGLARPLESSLQPGQRSELAWGLLEPELEARLQE